MKTYPWSVDVTLKSGDPREMSPISGELKYAPMNEVLIWPPLSSIISLGRELSTAVLAVWCIRFMRAWAAAALVEAAFGRGEYDVVGT